MGMGGGTPIFSYIFRFGALFLVQNLRKSNTFGSMKICGIFFFFFFFFFGGGGGGGGGHHEIGLFYFFFRGGGRGVISIHYRAF